METGGKITGGCFGGKGAIEDSGDRFLFTSMLFFICFHFVVAGGWIC